MPAPIPGTVVLMAVFVAVVLCCNGCSDKEPIAPPADPVERLTQLTDDEFEKSDLCWSRYGDAILYRCVTDGSAKIFRLDVSARQSQVFADGPGDLSSPDLTADGTTVAMISRDSLGERSVVMAHYPSGQPTQLQFWCDAGWPIEVSWSRTGEALAVLYTPFADEDWLTWSFSGIISVVNIGGITCDQLPTSSMYDGNGSIRWANQTDLIAYHYAWNVGSVNNAWRIMVLPTNGDPDYDVAPGGWRDQDPDWSPDDTLICFVSNRGGNDDIWIAASDNSGIPWQLTSDTDVESCPRWSPDGTRIAFISNRGGQTDIWTIPIPNPDSR